MKNERAKHIMYIIIGVLLFISIVLNLILVYQHEFYLDFEEVYREKREDIKIMGRWYSIKDKKYRGFYSEENFPNYNFDCDNYTYIVTFGYELETISYSFSRMIDKRKVSLGLPRQFVGEVVYEDVPTNYVYIYKVKKLNIDRDVKASEKQCIIFLGVD
jgi:hypothetical protein